MDSTAYPAARLESAPTAAPVSFTSTPPTPLSTSPTGTSPAAVKPGDARSNHRRRWASAVGLLLAVNLGLAGANLHLFGLPPFKNMIEMVGSSTQDRALSVAAPSDGPNGSSSAAAGIALANAAQATPASAEAALAEPAAAAGEVAERPMKVMAAISETGELMLAGSVADDATAQQLIDAAAAHLPGGQDQILADLKVHPNAQLDPSETRVLLWEPAIFAPGSSVLDARYTPILDVGIEILASSPDLQVAVTGHASPDGPITPNLFLSAERVAAVLAYFAAAGVPEAQILTTAAGESQPQDGDSGRRVEVEIANFFSEG